MLEWRGWMILPEIEPLLFLWDSWRPDSLTAEDAGLARAEFERLGRDWLRDPHLAAWGRLRRDEW